MSFRVIVCLISLGSLAMPLDLEAQPTCELPISAYVTDAADAALSGELDVELRFYADPDPGAEPAECRSFDAVTVDRGWLRVAVDGCAVPAVGDCGVAPLSELFADAPGVWVGVWVDGSELGTRIPVGAVPFAFRAGDSDLLQGQTADEFADAAEFGTHEGNPDAHHSSTSDGISITPSSVTVGDTQVGSGVVDLGPDATDELTDEIVRTLTGGGAADALHGHVSTGGNASCYTAWGAASCIDGFTAASSGVASIFFWSGGVGAQPFCLDSASIEAVSPGWPGAGYFALMTISNDIRTIDLNTTDLSCVVCCQE
jgi:hypothetical protein